jgi:hypothetical protein
MDEKRWLNEVRIPRGILPIRMNAGDSSVLNMFLQEFQMKCFMPSVYAGPDVMMESFWLGISFLLRKNLFPALNPCSRS